MEIIVQDVLMEQFMILKLKNVFTFVDKILLMTIPEKYAFVYQDMESIKMFVINVQHHSLFKITIVLPVQMTPHTMLILKDVSVIVVSL
jgi:hypothetical protein